MARFANGLITQVQNYQAAHPQRQPNAIERRAADTAPPAAAAPPPLPPPPAPAALPTFTPSVAPKLSIDRSGVNKQFDVARQRTQQTENAQLQGQRDALARRAAALGGGPGGAFVKAEQNAMGASAERLGQANQEIDAARQAKEQELAQMEAQANFQAAQQQQGFDLEKYKADTATALQQQSLDYQKGRDAINDKKSDDALQLQKDQAKQEREDNLKTNTLSSIISLKNSGFQPEAIGKILSSIGIDYAALGIDPGSLFGIPGTTAAASAQHSSANAAPSPSPGIPPGVKLNRTGSKTATGSDGRYYTQSKDGTWSPVGWG